MPSENVRNFGVVEVTDTALTLTSAGYSGVLVVSNLAAAQTFTLPAATGSGNVYRIFVKTTKTGDLVIQAASASDVMNGVIGVATDAAGVNIPTAATSDTLTMNGSTTGGVQGSYVELTDAASGVWHVGGALVSTGTEATPFSAAVS